MVVHQAKTCPEDEELGLRCLDDALLLCKRFGKWPQHLTLAVLDVCTRVLVSLTDVWTLDRCWRTVGSGGSYEIAVARQATCPATSWLRLGRRTWVPPWNR